MADTDEQALARLEAALDRIAHHADSPGTDPAPLAARLDSLIARLRDGLAAEG